MGEDRKPTLTDEEESGSSTSSCDEMSPVVECPPGDSDTASAPSPSNIGRDEGPLPEKIETEPCENQANTDAETKAPENSEDVTGAESIPILEPQVENQAATGQMKPTAVVAPSTKEDYDSSATETADEGQGGGEIEAARASTPKQQDDEPSSPLTVKDLMLGVIEMTLKKNPGQTPKVPPSSTSAQVNISTILKSDNALNFSQKDKAVSRTGETNNSLATVSIVSSHHSHSQPSEVLPSDSLVVSQVKPSPREPREPEPITLDLSIKKPRETNSPGVNKALSQPGPPQVHSVVYRMQPHSNRENQPFYSQVGPVVTSSLPPKLSPKLTPNLHTPVSVSSQSSPQSVAGSKTTCGSIIRGTPVSSPNIYNQNRYDPPPPTLLRQLTPPHKEAGSITQGTPVHQRSPLYIPPNNDFYNKRASIPPTFYPAQRPPAYAVEQRQIIMNDYITSQQMHGAGASSSSRRDKMYYSCNTRQGVIQRHPKPPSPGHYPAPPPPGHEAFSSLVDVAVRQPSLPVPPTITMPLPELKNSQQEDKRHLHEGLGERFNRESPHDRFREQERYNRESHKQTRDSHNQPMRDHQSRDIYMREQQQYQLREMRDQQLREHQIREQQIREQQLREHQIRDQQFQQQIRDNHHQIQREREMQQQFQQQIPRDRDMNKLRENHILQQREIDQRSSRQHISGFQTSRIHEAHPLIQQVSYPREQQAPTHQPPRSHSTQEQSPDVSRARSCESSFTAASLIDAIITHQINQSSDAQGSTVPPGTNIPPQSQSTRPGDRLFQGFHRDTPEPNGKISPKKPCTTPDVKVVHSEQVVSNASVLSQNLRGSGEQQLDMFSNSQTQSSRPGSYQNYDPHAWKLRRALQPKDEHAAQLREKNDDRTIVRYYSEPPVSLSPLDYVKNRIAEVMRTSEEEGASKTSDTSNVDMIIEENEPQPTPVSFIPTSHTYTYPFSALSINTATAPPPLPPPTVVKTGTDPIPEPAPILSSQYDPLSDED